MTEVKMPVARSQETIGVMKLSIHLVLLGFGKEAGIMFWRSVPVAALSSGVVYHHQTEREAGATKAISALEPSAPHVACDASTFDFIIGSLFTCVGLPLTTALKGGIEP